MSRRSGVSAAEKRTRMLALLHETQDFFVLKEIEKLATKSKGVVSQSVKEVLQELKDDRLIECEKIGTSNYYWAFPATAAVAKEAAFATQTAELASLRSTEKQLSSDVQMALVGREPADDRAALLGQLATLQQQEAALDVDLASYGLADPAAHESKRRAIEIARAEACKWTENTLLVFRFVKTHSGLTETEIKEQFGIPETWEEGYC